ncbi:MAG: membrane dipeptidase [bacterium]
MSGEVVSAQALRIYRDAYVIDTHNDLPSKILDDGYDPDVRHPAGFGRQEGSTDLPRLVESGLTAGVDHVGLGSDFDGVSALPEGMEDVTRLPRIAQALLARDYSDTDVQKMLGGNMLRVMTQVLDQTKGGQSPGSESRL